MPGPVPPRPDPPRGWGERLHAWLAWVGVGRLIASAASVVVVAVGVGWLVRSPAPPSEAGLPVVGSTSTVAVTLPVPDVSPSEQDVDGGSASSLPAHVFVHVAGAVLSPGVYQMAATDRVHAAIAAAGGPGIDAELDGLNLAAPLRDGERIYVPVDGEVDPAAVPSWPSGTVADPPGAVTPAGPVDLNEASADQLVALPGIGPATAAAIVQDRERRGPFATVDELQRVPGIGPAKLEAVAGLVTV